MKKKATFILFIGFFLVSCSIFRSDKDIVDIEINYDKDAAIHYGREFNVNVYAIYKNGKRRNISRKSDLSVNVEGGDFTNGTVKIEQYPTSWLPDSLKVEATYSTETDSFSTQKSIPFNYKGELKLDFSGQAGTDGRKGKDRGTPLLFRDGNDGGDGEKGNNGEQGNDLTVLIWKAPNHDYYRIKITDLIANINYYYTYRYTGSPLIIMSNGGMGGEGGNGGDGGTGKNGVSTDEKDKRPGDGGNGGNGGDGGMGGDGGTVYITFHPNAIALKDVITVYNFGGDGGQGGLAGEAGEPGDPANEQDAGEYGVEGNSGQMGLNGNMGETIIVTEPFDFEFE